MGQCQSKMHPGPKSRKRCTAPSEIIYSANGFKDVDLCWEHWGDAAGADDTPAWIEKNCTWARKRKKGQ